MQEIIYMSTSIIFNEELSLETTPSVLSNTSDYSRPIRACDRVSLFTTAIILATTPAMAANSDTALQELTYHCTPSALLSHIPKYQPLFSDDVSVLDYHTNDKPTQKRTGKIRSISKLDSKIHF